MKILSLHIENFGKLHDFDLTPEAGMNVLYRKNGWGKSTLAAFIKAMFYGMPATTKRSLDENERKKYAPWQGGAYGGSLDFACGRGRFRVERSFAQKESADSFALFDLATNQPSCVFSSALGDELFGIDADGFERTTYLSGRRTVGRNENNSIAAKLGNLLDDTGDVGNYDVALAALEKRRRYYTVAGNRGAIAELENERIAKQTELDRCLAVRETLAEREAELDTCTRELYDAQKRAEALRAREGKLGLAHVQEENLRGEIASLRARRDRIDAVFGGLTPTRSELEENRALYDRIKEARARLDAIPKAIEDAEAFKRLGEKFPAGVPAEEELARLERDRETLQKLRVRRETLRNTIEREEEAQRFPKGAPSPEELTSAREALTKAENLQKTLGAMSAKKQTDSKNGGLPWVIALLFLGAVLTVISFLPSFEALSTFLLVGGMVALVGGGVLAVFAIRKHAREQKAAAALQAKLTAWQAQREASLRTVKAFLESYGMSTSDPSRSLTELALLADQHREKMRVRRRMREELAAVERRREEIGAGLDAYLSQFFDVRQGKDDYRAEIERLRQESAYYLRLKNADRRRRAERGAAETELSELKDRLRLFLRRCDATGATPAGELLDRVGLLLTEREHLNVEIIRHERELKAFLSQQRAEIPDGAETADAEGVRKAERETQQRITELQRRQATLRSAVERLSEDADRIPALGDELKRLGLCIDEARANAETVMTTAKFLEEAKTALSTRYLGGMQSSFDRFLRILSGADSPEALMDTSFAVRLREGGKTREMESYSRGKRDAVEFCLRLSLTDALYADGEKPFLLLDDPFVNLDDDSLDAARHLLDSLAESYQILYLVCHKERI